MTAISDYSDEQVINSEKMKEQFKLTWNIKDLKVWIMENEFLISPNFGTHDHQWHLRIEKTNNYSYSNGKVYKKSINLNIFICPEKDEENKIKDKSIKTVSYSISIHYLGTTKLSKAAVSAPSPDICVSWCNIEEDLFDEVKIQCILKIYLANKVSISTAKTLNVNASLLQCRTSMIENYENLLDNEEFSDIKIKCESKLINCHKAVLALRSPVLRAMIQTEMKEKLENTICIDDVSYDILKKALEFLYAGNIKNISNDAKELIPIAEKYQIDDLKKICEQYLASQVQIGSVEKTLKFANLYRCDLLKEGALHFIKQEMNKHPEYFNSLQEQEMYHLARVVDNIQKNY